MCFSVIFSVLFSTRRFKKQNNKKNNSNRKTKMKANPKTKQEREILNEMLTFDTLCLFKAYRINKSRARSPEEIPTSSFEKTNRASKSFLLYYLTVIKFPRRCWVLLFLHSPVGRYANVTKPAAHLWKNFSTIVEGTLV